MMLVHREVSLVFFYGWPGTDSDVSLHFETARTFPNAPFRSLPLFPSVGRKSFAPPFCRRNVLRRPGPGRVFDLLFTLSPRPFLPPPPFPFSLAPWILVPRPFTRWIPKGNKPWHTDYFIETSSVFPSFTSIPKAFSFCPLEALLESDLDPFQGFGPRFFLHRFLARR